VADEAQAVRGVVDLGGQPTPAAPDNLLSAAARARLRVVALDVSVSLCEIASAVHLQHVRLGHGLRVLHQVLPHALLGPAAEPLLGGLSGRHEAAKLGPGAVAPQHHEAGAHEPA